MILLAELVFARIEYFIVSRSRAFNLYVEYAENGKLGTIVDTVKKTGANIMDIEVTKGIGEKKNPCVIISVRSPRRLSNQALMTIVARIDGVIAVEEL